MKFSIVKNRSGGYHKWVEKVKEVDEQWVEVGHFAEQGQHYSKLLYSELMALWHMGKVPNQPARMLMSVLYAKLQNLEHPTIRKARDEWKRTGNTNGLLDRMGRELRAMEKGLFGAVSEQMPPDSTGTPLVETGSLRDKTAYKTSKNSNIQEGG